MNADERSPAATPVALGQRGEREKVAACPEPREDSARPRQGRAERAGRAGIWALLALGALALLLFSGAWRWVLPGGVQRVADSPAVVPQRPDSSPPLGTGVGRSGEDVAAARGAQDPAAPRAMPQDEPAARPPSAADFRGRGSIRGTVVLGAGAVLPATWTVAVGPSRSLVGRERAETRRLERPGDRNDFELTGLPLGGYDVRIEAQGLASHPVPVLLVRGSEQAFVNVAVHRRGILDGFLIDGEGAPLEGIQVVLEDEASGARQETSSSAIGAYAFTDLLDSEYRIYFGGVTHPLIPPEELSFRAPSMRYPARRMPPLGSLRLRTIDPEGNPIAQVLVHGFSASGGLVEVETDELGLARADNLRPGLYRLAARHAQSGREGRISLEIEGGREEAATIPLVPRH